MTKKKDASNQSGGTLETCPNCGHCPTCGRSDAVRVAPFNPWYPYQPYQPSPWWGVTPPPTFAPYRWTPYTSSGTVQYGDGIVATFTTA